VRKVRAPPCCLQSESSDLIARMIEVNRELITLLNGS
jgi:hypothetical protein